MSGSVNSVVTNRDRDCLACRFVSGAGLMGAGFYVNSQSKKFDKKSGKAIMFLIANVLGVLGAARIAGLSLKDFGHKSHE